MQEERQRIPAGICICEARNDMHECLRACHCEPHKCTSAFVQLSRLVKRQFTCFSGLSRETSVTVGPCFKCDSSLVRLAVVSNHFCPPYKAHLWHTDLHRVRDFLLKLAIRGRCGYSGFDSATRKQAGSECLADHANVPQWTLS